MKPPILNCSTLQSKKTNWGIPSVSMVNVTQTHPPNCRRIIDICNIHLSIHPTTTLISKTVYLILILPKMVLSALANVVEKLKKRGENKKRIISLLTFTVSFLSFVFVMWQITNFFARYIWKPEGTRLSIEKTANLPFPAITICNYPRYNLEELRKCGLIGG